MYTTDTYKKPFWAENSGFMTGRDPLGVQNSSITTYGRLLPGMTNLTLRLRYYGLYLWLLSEYYNEGSFTPQNKLRGHYNFVRRAELIIAFIMRNKFPGEQSIIGSDFTEKKETDLTENGYYNIHAGADKINFSAKEKVYWDYPSGALGQYYAGSLIALSLIEMKGKFFTILPEGYKLAKAFASTIPDENRKKFIEIINSGRLNEEDIQKLASFSINKIRVGSEEWKYYQNMLLNDDGQNILDANGATTSLRKESISLYLNYIAGLKQVESERHFITNQYQLNLKNKFNEASFGWYYYYINEAIHFALETIFWSVLIHLDGKEQLVEQFFNDITKIVHAGSEKVYVTSIDQTISEILETIKDVELVSALEKLENEVKSPANSEIAIIKAFQLIFIIYKLNKERKEEIIAFEKKYKVWGQKGRVSENLNAYVEESLERPYKIYVLETIKKILNDHVNTAYRKMGNGESNLLKFIIEDGIITHVQTMTPRHTSPRLRTISNFMHDLSLIDKENNITTHGVTFLENMGN